MITLLGVYWFGVPFQGNPWLLAWLSLLFTFSGLGLGLLISTIAKSQKEAQTLTSLLMMLTQLLTGFIYPRSPMPAVVKAIGNLIPLTYFIRIVRGIVTKGRRPHISVERRDLAHHLRRDGDVLRRRNLQKTTRLRN